eukprot:UN22702
MDLVNKKSKKRLGGMLEGRFNKRKRRKQKRGSVSNDSEPRVKEIQPPGTYTDNACFDSFVENQFGRKNSQSLIRLMELAKASKTSKKYNNRRRTTNKPNIKQQMNQLERQHDQITKTMATPSRRRSRGHIGKAGRRVLNITHKKTKYQDMINRRSSFKIPTYRDDPQPDFDSSEEEQGGVDDNNSYQSHSTTTANTYEKPRRKERLGGMLNKKKRNQYITKRNETNGYNKRKKRLGGMQDKMTGRQKEVRTSNPKKYRQKKSYESEFQPDFPLREGGKKQNNVELDAFGRPVRKRKNHVHLQ